MVSKELIIEVHEHFQRQVTLNDSYTFKPNPTDDKCIENFLSFILKDFPSAGKNWTINYFESCWNYWYERKDNLKYGLSSVQLNWLIGKKSYKRWYSIKDQDSTFNPFFRKIKETKISSSELFQKDSNYYKSKLVDLDEFEEAEKLINHNTDLGLYNCVNNTTLYNHKSTHCMICIHKKDCKDILRQEFPKLNKYRGYES